MALSTISIKDGNGNAVTLLTNNYTGSNQQSAVIISDGTNVGPTMDAVARPGFQKITDGTNTMPTMDVVARKGFVSLTDGTSAVAVKAASTAAVATDPSLVVSLNPNNPAGTNADAAITAGTAPAKALLQAWQFLAWGSLPACTSAQTVAAQCDPAGTQKVGVIHLGTPIYATASSGGAAAANTSLTIPSAKMGFLDGFDIDGLGATAGSAISVTVTGLLGGTLTYTIGIPAGVTVPFHQSFRFNPPLQGSATRRPLP